MRKRVFALMMCFCMIFANVMPATALAQNTETVCENHTVHTAECSYSEGAAEIPCTHICDDSCTLSATSCVHTHDENCGYTPAAEASPCTHSCESCAAEPESNLICTCGTDDPTIHSTLCTAYTAPENPECFCVEQCPEDAPNEWCDICGVQSAAACKGGGDAAAAFAVGDKFTVDDLTYQILTEEEGNNTVGVYGAAETATTANIPDTVTNDGKIYTVVSILPNAFYNHTTLASVTVPNSVTSIGECAFQGCYSLDSITIPDSVTTIGDYAFQGCYSLDSITIPDSVTTIGDYAFSGCTNITSITIPDSVTSLGEGVFSGCSRLQSVTLPDNSSFTAIPNSLFSGCSLIEISIPDSVTSIGASAFHNTALTSITIPNGVTTIEYATFSRCMLLTSITLPDGMTSIGSNAFSECTELKNVYIPKLTGGSSKAVLNIASGAFTNTTAKLYFTGGTMDVVGTENIPSAVVTGGSINFTDAPEGFSATDGSDRVLYLNTISFRDFSGSKQTWMSVDTLFSNIASASTLSYYGTEGMMTDANGKLYLWLPSATTLQGASSGASAWQYTDGDSSTENDSFITQAEASDLVFEPYLAPGTSFPITVDVLGYSNAKGFIYAQGASLNKDSTGLSVGEKGKTYYLMIDSDSAVSGVNPLPDAYSVVGLYLNEEPPADGSYSISNKFTTGINQWTEGGESYGGTTYQFTMPEEAVHITAVIAQNGTVTIQNCAITYDANGGSGQMAGGIAAQGASFTLPECGFTPPDGKQFKAWLINDVEYAPGDGVRFTEDTGVVAVWEDIPTVQTYTVNVSAGPAEGGTVSGGGTFDENASVTVTATANSGYRFVKWTENDTQVSTSESYTFDAAADRTLVAVFEADTPSTHSHSWTGAWGSSDTHHWRECANTGCDVTDNSQKGSYAAHSYSGGVCECGKTDPGGSTPSGPSGSSGSSGDSRPSAPSAQQITVPISGEDNTIHVGASVSGDTATIDQVDFSHLNSVVGDHVENVGVVTIDLSGLNKGIDTVKLPADVVKQITDAANDPNNDAKSMKILFASGTSIEFDAKALDGKSEQMGGKDIAISVKDAAGSALNTRQQQTVGSRPALDIHITSGGRRISDFGGEMRIQTPYTLRPGERPEWILVYYVDDTGNKERCETNFDSQANIVSWVTSHNSVYMIDHVENLPITVLPPKTGEAPGIAGFLMLALGLLGCGAMAIRRRSDG